MLAAAVRLLEIGFFRIGSEEYAVENASYGLATMRKEHVTIEDDGLMVFDYPAKSGQRRHQGIADERAGADRRGAARGAAAAAPELLAYKAGGRWRDVRSEDINEYLKDATGGDFSAKDFRTWNATALAAVALAVSGASATTKTARKRAINRAVKEVAQVPRQHARGLPRLLHRPARVRRLRRRPDHPARRSSASRRRSSRASCRSTSPSSRRAVLDLIDERASSGAIERLAA